MHSFYGKPCRIADRCPKQGTLYHHGWPRPKRHGVCKDRSRSRPCSAASTEAYPRSLWSSVCLGWVAEISAETKEKIMYVHVKRRKSGCCAFLLSMNKRVHSKKNSPDYTSQLNLSNRSVQHVRQRADAPRGSNRPYMTCIQYTFFLHSIVRERCIFWNHY
jgi:hypothetical protein